MSGPSGRVDNDEAYAQGLLTKALDPSTQPAAIRLFLDQEATMLRDLLPVGGSVIDFGCGTGRHLVALDGHVSTGVGFDYERTYIHTAVSHGASARSLFFVADATAAPLTYRFDAAVCLTNTWGTMTDQQAVLQEMRRLSPAPGSRFVTVYALSSIAARTAWYENMGHHVLETNEERVVTDGGFTSEHFSEARLQQLLGPCDLHPIGDIAFLAQC